MKQTQHGFVRPPRDYSILSSYTISQASILKGKVKSLESKKLLDFKTKRAAFVHENPSFHFTSATQDVPLQIPKFASQPSPISVLIPR